MSEKRTRVFYYLQQPHRLGQLIQEVFFLRNLFDDADYDFVVITPPPDDRVNKACYDFIMQGVRVVQKQPGEFQWSTTEGVKHIDGDIYFFRGAFDEQFDFLRKFQHKKPSFFYSLSNGDIDRIKRMRAMFGIPQDAPVVTLHNREEGYLREADTHEIHAFRNADINNYVPAIEYLLSKGYYVVRIGDKTMQPLPELSERVIDAPFHKLYSSFVELCFIATCRFYLGIPSGPQSLQMSLPVPGLIVNSLIKSESWGNEGDIYLMKKYYSHVLKRYLSYSEVVTSPLPDFQEAQMYRDSGVELHENSAQEILEATREMDARLNGEYSPDQFIAKRIKQIEHRGDCYRKHACHRHPFLSIYGSGIQIGHEFIKMNPWFIEDKNWEPAEGVTSKQMMVDEGYVAGFSGAWHGDSLTVG